MQKVWTQAARPRLSCHSSSGYDTVSTVLTRRTTSAPVRRRLTFRDAFTILLAPVLATALVADTGWKDKRRRDWDEKIEEVMAAADKVRARERQLWSTLQQRSICIGVQHQRRFYATAAYALSESPEPSDTAADDEWPGLDAPEDPAMVPIGDHELLKYSTERSDSESMQALRRIQRLIAVKMAIKMILNVYLGHSPRYGSLSNRYSRDSGSFPPFDIHALATKMNEVTKSLVGLMRSRPNWTSVRLKPSNDQACLDGRLVELGQTFGQGHITTQNFIENVARTILESTESPTSRGYVGILQALGRSNLYDLAFPVINALDEGSVNLHPAAVFHIVHLHGINQDAYRFHKFLKRLTGVHRQQAPGDEWEWWRVNGIQVPVPVSTDAGLLSMLIYTSLRLDQPHKAEAWASILMERNHGGKQKAYVLNNFLKYYASHLDWQKGKVWLKKSQFWLSSVADDSMQSLQRVVLAMLHLCVACGQREMYAKILKAAAKSQIGVLRLDPSYKPKFLPRSVAIMTEWEDLHNEYASSNPAVKEYHARAQQFQDFLEDGLKQVYPVNQPVDNASSKPAVIDQLYAQSKTIVDDNAANLSAIQRRWEESYQSQQSELAKLRTQLSQATSLHRSLSTAVEQELRNQPRLERELIALRTELEEARAQALASADANSSLSALKRELDQLRSEMRRSRSQEDMLANQDQDRSKESSSLRRELEQLRVNIDLFKTLPHDERQERISEIPVIQESVSRSHEEANSVRNASQSPTSPQTKARTRKQRWRQKNKLQELTSGITNSPNPRSSTPATPSTSHPQQQHMTEESDLAPTPSAPQQFEASSPNGSGRLTSIKKCPAPDRPKIARHVNTATKLVRKVAYNYRPLLETPTGPDDDLRIIRTYSDDPCVPSSFHLQR